MTIFSPLAASDMPLAFPPPADPEDAYENRLHIPNADRHLANWPVDAAAFRDHHQNSERDLAYGTGARTSYDLFLPAGGIDAAKGVVGVIHGGYWVALSKDDFSHLAVGLLDRGWAVAMIGYTLAPQARIASITQEIAAAVSRLGEVGTGPLRLAGHSAGGHLVTRMMCRDVTLGSAALDRLDRVVSISGLHDLRPLQRLAKNDLWQLDDAEAVQEVDNLAKSSQIEALDAKIDESMVLQKDIAAKLLEEKRKAEVQAKAKKRPPTPKAKPAVNPLKFP